MKTRSLLLALSLLLVPATASADWIGAFAQWHGGYVKTDRDSTWAVGPQVALQILGFEIFADMRFLEAGFTGSFSSSNDQWFWDRVGLRYTIGLPFLISDEPAIFADLAYIASNRPYSDDVEDVGVYNESYIGLGGTLGIRLEWELVSHVYLGVEGEYGGHFLFPNEPGSAGQHFAALSLLKLDV